MSYDLGPQACVLEDATRLLDVAAVLTPEVTARFSPVPSGLVDFGFGRARYWVRVRIANGGNEAERFWITHDIPSADLVRVRLVRAGGTVEPLLTLSGDDPFDARAVPHRHLVSTVALEPSEEAELVIDYVTGQSTQMPLVAETVDLFTARTQQEMAWHLLIIALVLGMGAISTLYFYSLEGAPGLIYGAYSLSAAWFLAHAEGYGFQLLYPNWPGLNLNAFALLGFCTLAFSTWFISRLTRTRTIARPLYWAVTISVSGLLALVALAPVFIDAAWYKIGGLLMAIFSNIVQVAVIVVALRERQSGAWLLLAAFVATGIGIAMVATGYMTEGLFPQEVAGAVVRAGFLFEAVAYSGAIALRIRDARRERDASLRDQLRLSREALRLSAAVQHAEAERRDAEIDADMSRRALSDVAHDIRQPLTSIQMQLADQSGDLRNISDSLGYIDTILRAGLESGARPLGAGDPDPVESGVAERFPIGLVLGNVAAMFRAEAEQRSVSLRVLPCSAEVVTDPLSVMRAISNLVSNSLKHAQAERIVVGCRRCGDTIRVEVHDNGRGMSQAVCAALARRGAKGETSEGHGLGLSIIHALATEQDLRFDLVSTPGRGTVGSLAIPIAAALPRQQGAAT